MSAPPGRPSSRPPSSSSSSPWPGRTCTPAQRTRPQPTGARPTCTARPGPARRSRCPVGRRVRPRRPRRRARDHPRRRPTADRRRPRARPPAPATLEPGDGRRGPGVAGPADRPGDHRPLRRGRAVRGPADRRHPARIGQVQAARLVQEARLYFDPDRAVADEEEALAKRGVWLRHGGAPATTDVFDDPGHPRRRAPRPDHRPDRRRPQRARRHRGPRCAPRPRRRDPRRPPTRPGPDVRPRRRRTQPAARAVRRTSTSTSPPPTWQRPRRSTGAASIEKLGAATTQLLTDWLARFTAPAPRSPSARSSTSTPTGPWTSTTHPRRCARPSMLRDAHCVFPGCRRDSRACDLDHITEYLPLEDGGPPGQTRPGNLAPLCRTHHRVKTHSAWHYKRLDDGSYVWTAPTGHQYNVIPAPRRLTRRTSDRPPLRHRRGRGAPRVAAAPRATATWWFEDRSLRSLLDHQWLRSATCGCGLVSTHGRGTEHP